ncbi:(d)CMP kinase [Candidatus Woesebacteria bacterium]|nr:(d)CMP kinase [Candidatus Woesebacteria bacterium]
MSNTLFIGIDGYGGSGKSSLAKYLSQKLDAEIIHTDDFASWDNPLEWWRLLGPQIFVPIQNGCKALTYQKSQWWENPDQLRQPVVDQPVTRTMILEGVSALRKEFRQYISFGIFVDTPIEICIARGVARDILDGSKKSREEIERMWREWANGELKYFENHSPKAFADLTLDGTRSFEQQIG